MRTLLGPLMWLLAAMALGSCGHTLELDPEPFLADCRAHGSDGCLRLMHVSDVHGRWLQLDAMLSLAEMAGADAVANTGDDFMATDSLPALLRGSRSYRQTVDRHPALAVVGAQGNHDLLAPRRHYHRAMFAPMAAAVSGFVSATDSPHSLGGHVDLPGGFRLILLDPRSGLDDDADWWHVAFSQAHMDWLAATLADARARGLRVITMMHYAFGDSPTWNHTNVNPDITYLQDPFMIPDLIDALQHGTALSRTYTPRHSSAQAVTLSITPSEQRLHFVAHLFGHLHSKEEYRCAKADGSMDYDLLMLGEASLATEGVALDSAPRRPGTDTDLAASMLIVDPAAHIIHRVSFGAYLTTDGRRTSRTQSLRYRLR